jgi:hypothetical protein
MDLLQARTCRYPFYDTMLRAPQFQLAEAAGYVHLATNKAQIFA